tara:strand:+ start:180 stop:749 length:570 start_codon:yes stop_codon:yes gene_type:complete
MALVLNGSTNTIGGLAVGGLPDGVVDADMLASGVGGKVLQYKVSKKTNSTSTNSTGYSEISNDFRISLTPTASNTTIIVIAYLYSTMDGTDAWTFRLRRNTASDFSGTSTDIVSNAAEDGNDDGIGTCYNGSNYNFDFQTVSAWETSGNTTARTYSPFWRVANGTVYLNSRTGSTYLGVSTMSVLEVGA